jgi:hypothetical protein
MKSMSLLLRRGLVGPFWFPYSTLMTRHKTMTASKVKFATPSSSYLSFFSSAAAPNISPKGSRVAEVKKNHLNSAHVETKIPENDYYHGHLLYDQLEYVNDVIEKTIMEMEDSVETLEDLHGKKLSLFSTIRSNDSTEIENLFEESAEVKATMKRQLSAMKQLLKNKRINSSSFAVDAPNGVSDDFMQREIKEVQHILFDTPTIEVKAAALQEQIRQNRNVNGVDAPDGTCDAMTQDELNVIQYILNHSKKASSAKKQP